MSRDTTRRLFIALWGLAAFAFFIGALEADRWGDWWEAFPEWALPAALVAAAQYTFRPPSFSLTLPPWLFPALWALSVCVAAGFAIFLVIAPPFRTHWSYLDCPSGKPSLLEVLNEGMPACAVETRQVDADSLFTAALIGAAPLLIVATLHFVLRRASRRG